MTLEELHAAIAKKVVVRAGADTRIIHTGSGDPKDAPWLFDFRALMLQGVWLDTFAEIFWKKYAGRLPFQVGGLETAAIPLVSAIVMKSVERGTPINGFYMRKSRDRDGLMKVVEGTLTDEPVILVDDLINSGNSFDRQIKILYALGKRVSDIFVMLAFRAPEAYASMSAQGVKLSHLFTLPDFGLPLQSAHAPEIPAPHLTELWRFAAGSPSFEHVVQKSAPILSEGIVCLGSDKGVFYALRQKDGSIAWSHEIGKHPKGKGIFSSPAVHDGRVYFGAYDGVVYALDAKNGSELWSYSGADWVGSSPVIAEDLGLLFIGLEFGLFRKRGGIVALDLKTGDRRWIDRTNALTHGSPLYIEEERLVVIGSNDGVAYAYDAGNGERRWTYQSGSDIKTRPAYDSKRRLVLVPSMDSKLYALRARDGSPEWAFQTGAAIYSNPLISGDKAFIASLDKSLYAIELETGRKMWEFETGGRIFASPVLIEGSLWIGSNDGRLYEIDPESGARRGSHQFTERIVNAIAYDGQARRFFVSTVANETYCLARAA